MTGTIKFLPLYELLADGAELPTGRQYTIRWFTHINKHALLMDVGGAVFHLARTHRFEHPCYFNVIGELRDAEQLSNDLMEKILMDDGSRSNDEGGLLPTDDEWLSLPVHATIVVHLATKTFHVRDAAQWDRLNDANRAIKANRVTALHGVPSPIVSFCLEADSLVAINKYSSVLAAEAKVNDLPFETRANAQSILKEKLKAGGIDCDLNACAEWRFPENGWNSAVNTTRFAFARIGHPNASWSFVTRRVLVLGLQGPQKKMLYLGLTQAGVLSDGAVTLYNAGTRNSLAARQAAIHRAECSRMQLEQHWSFFSTEPHCEICFPGDPEMAKNYILALTMCSQARGCDESLHGKYHTNGCVCAWIPEDATQLACAWCGMEKFNGKKQFCDHINGQKHQKNCACELPLASPEALQPAVLAVQQSGGNVDGGCDVSSSMHELRTSTETAMPSLLTEACPAWDSGSQDDWSWRRWSGSWDRWDPQSGVWKSWSPAGSTWDSCDGASPSWSVGWWGSGRGSWTSANCTWNGGGDCSDSQPYEPWRWSSRSWRGWQRCCW